MCLLAVLGIALASYLAVSNQSMRLSNRAYAVDVSRHLAEMGLERALRSFSANTFSTWTRSGNQATLTFPITSSHYGTTGIGGTVYLRVDNYRDTAKAIPWSVLTAYTVNDYVWYQGVWYVCKSAPPANEAPSNTTYWTAAPAPWSSIANYRPGNIAILGGNAYRCILAHTNTPPPDTTYWTSYAASAWSAATTYSADDVVFSGGMAYRSRSTHLNHAPPDATYWLSAPVIYAEGVAVLPDNAGTTVKTQLRALVAPAALFPNAAGSTSYTNLAAGGTVDSYNSVLGTYLSQVSTPTNYSAVLAGGNTSSPAVNVITATVRGYVAAPAATTSPYDPWARFGTNTTVNLRNPDGSVTSPRSGSANVDNTRVSRSPYIPSFDIQSVTGTPTSLPSPTPGATYLPFGDITLGTAPTPGTSSTPTIYNITRTYYNAGGSSFSGMLLYDALNTITIDGPVILNVSGSYFGMWNGKITINPGGSLQIYFSSSTRMYFGMASGSGIENKTNDPTKLFIASTNPFSPNSINYHYFLYAAGCYPFYGTLYMPNAYVTAYGGAALYGAISAKNIHFPGTATVHYDTALRTAGAIGTFIDAPYQITEWRELTDPAEKITLP